MVSKRSFMVVVLERTKEMQLFTLPNPNKSQTMLVSVFSFAGTKVITFLWFGAILFDHRIVIKVMCDYAQGDAGNSVTSQCE
jgi:hypothetical protein